jgi:Ca2+-binding EF-hand superfamily protein
VKGSFRKKVQALFEFYDIDKTGSISYGELLKMVNVAVT